MLRQLIVKNRYGLRCDTLCVIATLYISFAFCVMGVITLHRFGTGIPVAGVVFIVVAVSFLSVALAELRHLWTKWFAIHDAIEADDCPQSYREAA
jgi:TRAP-type C4-dicarboxylate transport system permease small subunit